MIAPRLIALTIIATLTGAWGAQQRVIARFNRGEVASDTFDRNDGPKEVADKLRILADRIEREFVKS